MLTALRLRDFVIVDTLDLDLSAGFTVLSGETGAGKSILIDALSLLLGARADSHVVRAGASRADLSAEFLPPPALEAWLAERSLEGDAGLLQVRRIIDAEGRSKAYVNHHPANLSVLRTLADFLLDIHGQHAAQSLLRSEGQRDLLDRIARLGPDVAQVAGAFARWRQAQQTLDATHAHLVAAAHDRERLQWQLDEVAQLAPTPGEWEALNAEQRRLAHAANLMDGARNVAHALTEAESAITPGLYAMQQRLRSMAAWDAQLNPVLDLLESAGIAATEAASALNDYAERIELDPHRLAHIEQRISALFSLARKWRLPPESLAESMQRWQQELTALPQADDLAALQADVAAAHAAYQSWALTLSEQRRCAAATLAERASSLLATLGMPGAHLSIAIDAQEPAAHGIDRIEFQIAGHAGATPRPLAKVASGGELSRVSLAISALAAEANPVATLIFDEADAGVGGAVAEVIGALMRSLGQTRQVLCVTHLPQVAAQAHHHFRVNKQHEGGQTISRMTQLDHAARVDEIARMLGGVAITETTRQHARELLATQAHSAPMIG